MLAAFVVVVILILLAAPSANALHYAFSKKRQVNHRLDTVTK